MAVRELHIGETALAFRAMHELRPALPSLDEFVRQVDDLQRPEGYRLAASFGDDDAEAAAVAGFRIDHQLARGRHVYVDDLVTRADRRRRGHAEALFAWVVAEALREGCREVHLDSAHHRYDAHRFYLRQGMRMAAHHFVIPVGRDWGE